MRFDHYRQAVRAGELPDEFGIGIARCPAELVVEMRDMRPVPELDKRIEQRDGIRAAGDADEQRLAGRKQLRER